MRANPDVFLIGEDVGQFGGAFKVTKGFLDEFRPMRVLDTPIGESGFAGLAAEAALARAAASGRVPVRRLHLVRVRPDHQRRRPAPLPDRQRDADRVPLPVRRPDRRAVRAVSSGAYQARVLRVPGGSRPHRGRAPVCYAGLAMPAVCIGVAVPYIGTLTATNTAAVVIALISLDALVLLWRSPGPAGKRRPHRDRHP